MKKEVPLKYPHSANLFQFCRRVLNHKFGGVRIIDQDVGQILGYDPADCSHWKKGKKNIKSISAMRSIANHLGMDEKIVVDIANGELDDVEAFIEYKGYGFLDLDSSIFEQAKKEFFRKNTIYWDDKKETEFVSSLRPRKEAIDEAVKKLHDFVNFKEAPLYVPEVSSKIDSIVMKSDSSLPEINQSHDHIDEFITIKQVHGTFRDEAPSHHDLSANNNEKGTTYISWHPGTEARPFIRFKQCYGIGMHILNFNLFDLPSLERSAGSEEIRKQFPNLANKIDDLEYNLFATELICPKRLIKAELEKVNVSRDIVSQLAEAFWVSKAFMNRRLKNVLAV